MRKEEIKHIPVLNFNHQTSLNLQKLQNGLNTFIVKKGQKKLYFLEIDKNCDGAFIQRYDFKNATYSKYSGVNLCGDVFSNNLVIDYDFIANLDKISNAKTILHKYNVL